MIPAMGWIDLKAPSVCGASGFDRSQDCDRVTRGSSQTRCIPSSARTCSRRPKRSIREFAEQSQSAARRSAKQQRQGQDPQRRPATFFGWYLRARDDPRAPLVK